MRNRQDKLEVLGCEEDCDLINTVVDWEDNSHNGNTNTDGHALLRRIGTGRNEEE